MSDVPQEVLFRKFVYGLADCDGDVGELEAVSKAVQRVESLQVENAELRDRVAELEEQIGAISDIGQEKTTKEEKIAAIVTWAQRQAGDEETDTVLVKVKDIIGCTGVSRRYAYDLLDELPDRHEWLHDRKDVRQYGEVEQSQDTKARGLVVDLEQLHTDESAVNKFTTRTDALGVEG